MPAFFYRPALVEGIVVSAETREPIDGAEVALFLDEGPIPPAAFAVSDSEGKFRVGGRVLRLVFFMAETFPRLVIMRIDADGYVTRTEYVGGKVEFAEPLEISPE